MPEEKFLPGNAAEDSTSPTTAPQRDKPLPIVRQRGYMGMTKPQYMVPILGIGPYRYSMYVGPTQEELAADQERFLEALRRQAGQTPPSPEDPNSH